MEGLRSMPKNRYSKGNYPSSALQSAIISCFKLPGKDTLPIWVAAKVPHLGTNGKNHIRRSLSFV